MGPASRETTGQVEERRLSEGNLPTISRLSFNTPAARTIVFFSVLVYFQLQRPITMQSFIEYDANSDFPIENLPYGVFSTPSDVSTYNLYTMGNDNLLGSENHT